MTEPSASRVLEPPNDPAAAPELISTGAKIEVATGRSLMGTAWRRIRRGRVAMVALVVVCLIVLFAIIAPVLTSIEGSDPFTTHTGPDYLDDFYTPGLPLPYYRYPSSEHWLGLEPGLGRDLFARLAYGARISLTIALLASAISVVLGTVIGAAAGYFGGKVDAVISRCTPGWIRLGSGCARQQCRPDRWPVITWMRSRSSCPGEFRRPRTQRIHARESHRFGEAVAPRRPGRRTTWNSSAVRMRRLLSRVRPRCRIGRRAPR